MEDIEELAEAEDDIEELEVIDEELEEVEESVGYEE